MSNEGKRNRACAAWQDMHRKLDFGNGRKSNLRIALSRSVCWRTQVDDLRNRTLYHPLIAGAAIYLTEVMVSVDSSVGGALVVVAGGLALQLFRNFTRCKCCAE
jgi:hypothetical protein